MDELQRIGARLDEELDRGFRQTPSWGSFISIANRGSETDFNSQAVAVPDTQTLTDARIMLEELVNSRNSISTLALDDMFTLTEIPNAMSGGGNGQQLRRYFERKIMPDLWKMMQIKAEEELQRELESFWAERKNRLNDLLTDKYDNTLIDEHMRNVEVRVVEPLYDYEDYGSRIRWLLERKVNGMPAIQDMHTTLQRTAKELSEAWAQSDKSDKELGSVAATMAGISADFGANVMPFFSQYELCRHNHEKTTGATK